jgi:hypothetical protein
VVEAGAAGARLPAVWRLVLAIAIDNIVATFVDIDIRAR